jgi:phosphate transport system substrate-binding protein
MNLCRHALAILILALLAACGPTPAPTPAPTPTPALVLTIVSVPDTRPQLAGWIALYEDNHPGVALEVRADTFARAQEALVQGTADIALLDQEPLLYYRGMLTATRVAAEPIAVVTHPGNPVAALSSVVLVEVLSGHVGDWSEIGGKAGPVQVYLLPDSAGEVQYLAHTALAGRRLAPQAVVCASAESVLHAVEADPGGIGLLSASAVTSQVAVLRVDDMLPGEAGYPWQMPLFLAYGQASPPQARDFVVYIGRVK